MPDTSENGKYTTYEELDDGAIVRILLNRPRTRNAQNRGLLVELDEAFHRAEQDDEVRVVILGGVGPLFSSGHDMGSKESQAERAPGPDQHPSNIAIVATSWSFNFIDMKLLSVYTHRRKVEIRLAVAFGRTDPRLANQGALARASLFL